MIISMDALFMLCGIYQRAYAIKQGYFSPSKPEIEGKDEKQSNWYKKHKPIEQKVQGANYQGGEKPYPSWF